MYHSRLQQKIRTVTTAMLSFFFVSGLVFSGIVPILTYQNGTFELSEGIKKAYAATDTYNSDNTWTAPADVCSVTVNVWGGGEGGTTGSAGNGGDGGSFASSTISVVPGTGYTVTVGTGGGVGTAGGDSWFDTSTTIRAAGGGSASSNIGTVTYTGGTGGAGETAGSPSSRVGGGGGSAATTTSNGTNGADGSAGGAGGGSGQGAGGAGNSGAGNGGNGTAPGGAGGGSGNTGTGGSGADGRVTITYTTDPGCNDINISGTLYSDEGSTQITSGKTIKLAVGTTTVSVHSTSTDSGAGTFTFAIKKSNLTVGDEIVVWLDDDAIDASTISTIADVNTNISGLDLYADTVIVRNGATATATDVSVLEFYDNYDDTDLQYRASSTDSSLSILGGQKFHILAGYSFQAPASTTFSGSFHNDGGTYTAPSGTTTFSGASQTISGSTTGASSLGNIVIAGSYTMSNSASTSDLTIESGGSLIAPSTTLTVAGNYTNNGSFDNNGGTVVLSPVTGWNQIGGDGLNSSWAEAINVYDISIIDGSLYTAVETSGYNAEVWSYSGSSWSQIGGDDINSSWSSTSTYESVRSLVASGSALYAGLGYTSSDDGDVWEYSSGSWSQIGGDGLNSSWSASNAAAAKLFVDNGVLYAGLGSNAGDADVWEYSSGSWSQIGGDGLNSSWAASTYTYIRSITASGSSLYAGLSLGSGLGEVWEYNGSTWSQIGGDGLNSSWATANAAVAHTHNGTLYSGLDIGEVWEYNGSTWSQIGGDGLNSSWSTSDDSTLVASYGDLLVAKNGYDLWTYNGSTWSQIGGDGLNSSWSASEYNLLRSVLNSGTDLYLTTGMFSNEGDVWKYGADNIIVSGNLTGSSSFGNVIISGGTATFSSTTSLFDLIIKATSTVNLATSTTIVGDYVNNGTVNFIAVGTTTFSGTSLQTATGTMTGSSAFNNVEITNISGTDAQSAPSVIFGNDTAFNNFTASTSGVMIQFDESATATIANLRAVGNATDDVYLYSTVSGTAWNIDITGTSTVDYATVKDSNAGASTAGTIYAASSTDGTGNINWTFAAATSGGGDAWNATDWTLYDTITIESDNVDDDLTDFPVYVDLSDLSATFWSTTPSASTTVGTDIRVTTDGGSPTELPRELVFASSTLQTGELHFKADSISSTTDTTFRIYYNGTTTGDYATSSTYGAQNVWTNGYDAVYHFNEDPSAAGSGGIVDVTGNGNDGTDNGSMTAADSVTGRVGNAFDLDGSDDYISLTDIDYATGPVTWSVWSSSTNSGVQRMLSKYTSAGTQPHWILTSAGTIEYNLDNTAGLGVGSLSPTDGSWHYYTATADTSDLYAYFDGVEVSSTTHDNSILTDNSVWRVGSRDGTNEMFDGQIDEVRLASVYRSAAWVKAEYENQNDTATFYTVNQPLSISSAANQSFTIGDATTTISTITIHESATATSITAANDIRIAIATSTVAMLWDVTDTTATLSGSAASKVSGTVSYAGSNSVLVLDVTSDFVVGDTLIIDGLSFAQFGSENTAATALTLHTDGNSVGTAAATDDKTVTIIAGPATKVWNATDWTLYDTITIESDNVDDDLTDFPVYVDLSDLSATFWSTTATGTDIRVTTDGGSPTELPRELVFASTTLQTGELWFEADSISSTTDTTFRIYYNGTTTGDYATTSTYGAQEVWKNGFEAVYHLNEDPGVAGTGGILDSTGNGNNGTDNGSMTSADKVAGPLGYAFDFDGTDDFVSLGTGMDYTSAPLTLSAWFNQAINGATNIIDRFEAASDRKSLLTAANSVEFYIGDGAGQGTANTAQDWTDGNWHYVVGTVDATTLYLYTDTIAATTDTHDNTWPATADAWEIGGNTGEQIFIDEVRIASSTRTAAWIDAEYTNQSTTTDFYRVNNVSGGSTVTWDGGGGDGLWETATNWDTDAVPTAADDVVIDTTATVSLNASTTINSLTLGMSGGGASSTLSFDFEATSTNALTIDDGNFVMYASSTLTHATGSQSTVLGSIYVDVQTGDFTLNSGAFVNIDGAGYWNSSGNVGYGPGGGDATTATGGSGGSYGGQGGYSKQGQDPESTYGSTTAPYQLGSAGGAADTVGEGAGGGLFVIDIAGDTTLNGIITADGAIGNNGGGLSRGGGGGSGGGIFITTTGALSGVGLVTVDGGEEGPGVSNDDGGAGGGGRIAIIYNTGTTSNMTLTAKSGIYSHTAGPGAAGTIYTKSASETSGRLTVDNDDNVAYGYTSLGDGSGLTVDYLTVASSGALLIDAGETLTYTNLDWSNSGTLIERGTINFPSSLTVPSGATYKLDKSRTFTDLTIDGTLSHSHATDTLTYYIDLTVTNDFTLNSGGVVDLDGAGYFGLQNVDDGNGPGGGIGGAAGRGSGGAHGGQGGHAAGQVTILSTPYGSTTAPDDFGSAGGGSSWQIAGYTGAGGGYLILSVTGTTTIDGTISADGNTGGDGGSLSYGGGGGAGGGIYITTGGLEGAGTTTVNGGPGGPGVGSNEGGGGGGGRLAVIYTTGTTSTLALQAYGGSTPTVTNGHGAAGTIYIKGGSDQFGSVTIDNNGQETVASTTLGDIGNITVNNLTVTGSSTLAAPPSSVTVKGNLTLTGGGKTVSSGTYVLDGSNKKIQGDFTGSSTLGTLEVNGSYTIVNSASTTNITINSGGSLTAPAQMSLSGDYENNGTLDANSGHIFFNGTCGQTASGTMTGTSAFYDVTINNTCANGTTSRSVNFLDSASSTGTFTVTASSSVGFAAGATTTFNNVTWDGTSTTTAPVWIYSTATDTSAHLIVSGTYTIYDMYTRDTDVCGSSGGGLTATNSIEVSNTNCWTIASGATSNTWDAGYWSSYDTITIDASKVDDDLTNFPVYVDLSDLSASFWGTILDGGADVRVTTDDGSPVELPREIVSASTTLQTGEMHFRADSISSTTDTTFRIYYNGNGFFTDYATSDTYGAENVWTNDYIAVWHFDDDPSGTIYDSTSNSYDGAAEGSMVAGDEGSAKLGNGYTFDGANQMLDFGDIDEIDQMASSSFSIWGYRTTDNSVDSSHTVNNVFFAQSSSATNDNFEFGTDGTDYEVYGDTASNDSTQSYTADVTNNEWFHSYFTYGQDRVYEAQVFKNGVLVGSSTNFGGDFDSSATSPLSVGGARPNSTQNGEYIGTLDEARIASTTRSDAWIAAEYLNQSVTTDFYSINKGTTIRSDSDQTFTVGQATTTVSTIVVREDPETAVITAANDIRITISTSTVAMKWDTFDTTPTFGGSAASKVNSSVTYGGGGSVLIIDVTSDFSAGDSLTIDDLSFAQFTSGNNATSALALHIDGDSSGAAVATDTAQVTIGLGVWDNTNWTTYDTITIDATNINDDLTNFPVYVDLSDLSATFWSTVASDLGDIRITTDSGSPTELPYELVSGSYLGQTGELHFKADSISSTTDTTFRIYYNGFSGSEYAASATYGAQNVWTDYTAVWHLGEGFSTVAEYYQDSTANGYNLTLTDSNLNSASSTGKLGDAVDLSGTSDYLSYDVVDYSTATVTISSWTRPDTSATDESWFSSDDTTGGDTFQLAFSNTSGSYQYNHNDFTLNASAGDLNEWNYVAAVAGNGVHSIYHNGVDTASTTNSTLNFMEKFRVGINRGTNSALDGDVDEVRIASSTHSGAWIYAEYINQSTTTDFYRVNDVGGASDVIWNSTDWTNYDVITIDHTKVFDNLYDFPVYVDLSDLSPVFWATVSDGGGDIRVTTHSNSPTELAREVVFASTTLETGELHFKADYLNPGLDTSFRIYYNGTDIDYATSSTYGAQAVWSNGYDAVYHLNEDPGVAGTGGIIDSTGNGNDGTDSGMDSSNVTTGKTGNAISFAGSPEYIVLTDIDYPTGGFTVSTWFTSTNNASGQNLISKYSVGTNQHYLFGAANDSLFYGFYDGVDYQEPPNSNQNWEDGNWHYVAASVDDTNINLYVDDDDPVTDTHDNSLPTNNANWNLGRRNDGANYYNGTLDEVRFSSNARSAGWIKTEYYNQGTTTDFYTLVSGTGSTTLSNHDAGQVSNAFNFQNKTNEALFAFKLTPETGNATVTKVDLAITGSNVIDVLDFTNIRLYRDLDDDASYGASDKQVGGTGAMSITKQSGNIIFSEEFLSTTTMNYLVVADWNAPERGGMFRLSLTSGRVNMVDSNGWVDVYGSVNSVQHVRNNKGGGGGSAAIGGAGPVGDGDVAGGGQGGGQGAIDTNTGGGTIGNEVDFNWPSAESGAWNNPQFAYDATDGTYATTTTDSAQHQFTSYSHGVPGTDTVEGIEVKLEISGTTAAGSIDVALSWDGGASWSDTKTTQTLTTSDTVVTLGGSSDKWGSHNWVASDFSDANFVLRVTGNVSSNELRIDGIQVKVHHQATGGGSGGGGGAI